MVHSPPIVHAGLDGSYHPESDGTLMGAAMSVAKNVASNTSSTSVVGGTPAKTSSPPPEPPAATATKTTGAVNGSSAATNGGTAESARPSPLRVDSGSELNGKAESILSAQSKTITKPEDAKSRRKNSFIVNVGGVSQRQSPERKSVAERRPSGTGGPTTMDRRPVGGAGLRGSSPARGVDGSIGSPDIGVAGDKQRNKKKSSKTYTTRCLL